MLTDEKQPVGTRLTAPSSNGSSIAVELITSNKNSIASETSEGRGPDPDHDIHPASSDGQPVSVSSGGDSLGGDSLDVRGLEYLLQMLVMSSSTRIFLPRIVRAVFFASRHEWRVAFRGGRIGQDVGD